MQIKPDNYDVCNVESRIDALERVLLKQNIASIKFKVQDLKDEWMKFSEKYKTQSF